MSATARKHEPIEPEETPDLSSAHHSSATEYVTRGAKALRNARPHLRIVSPLRPERASRGIFALVVSGVLIAGMGLVLVINTSLAQGAFTISELKQEQAALTQQEQALSEVVAAAAAPEVLAKKARAMGMVPATTPVFLNVENGKVLGKPKAAAGAVAGRPALLTPADATALEAVDNAGADLPAALPAGYDPAAADEAAAGTADAAADAPTTETAAKPVAADAVAKGKGAAGAKNAGKNAGKGAGKHGENGLWQDATVMDMTSQLSSSDSGLDAVPVG
mgnify:CR=1 FL=1